MSYIDEADKWNLITDESLIQPYDSNLGDFEKALKSLHGDEYFDGKAKLKYESNAYGTHIALATLEILRLKLKMPTMRTHFLSR